MSEGVANYSAEVKRSPAGLLPILWAELKPFPGRDLAALRMAIACTAIVLVSNTFRLPFQDVLPFLALFTAKEEKITTAITALLALLAITVSVGAAILVFKCTGNRPEFRIPGMAAEIFVGMYLFRILSIGPVGFILAFIVSVSQSIVDPLPYAGGSRPSIPLGVGCGGAGSWLRLACHPDVISGSSEPRASERVCYRLANTIDCCKTIERWFAGYMPEITCPAGQARADPSTEVTEIFLAGVTRPAPKTERIDTPDTGLRQDRQANIFLFWQAVEVSRSGADFTCG